MTQSRLKEMMNYDKNTGIFTWIKKPCRNIPIGKVAGYKKDTGYVSIDIDKGTYPAHHLAWLYEYGIMPPEQIDHWDRVRNNNAIENLSLTSNQKNQMNKSKRRGREDFNGVYWNKRDSMWLAQITYLGKQIYLGQYKNKDEAIQARTDADVKYGFHTNHGKDL